MNYKILSVTSVAAVRGTSFSFSVAKKGKTKIKLLKGKVHTIPVKNGKILKNKAVDLKAGRKLVITAKAKIKIKKLKKSEKKSLKELNTIKLIPRKKIEKIIEKQIEKKRNILKAKQENKTAKNADKPKNEITDSTNTSKEQIENLAVINAIAKKVLIPESVSPKTKTKKMSLQQLKKKYGKLSKLVSKQGKSYIGILKDKGSKWEIITTSGKHYVKKKDVQNIKTY